MFSPYKSSIKTSIHFLFNFVEQIFSICLNLIIIHFECLTYEYASGSREYKDELLQYSRNLGPTIMMQSVFLS